ncbi:MAG: hypothetical protein RLY78_2149 [Pseudomonadota bacterium]|jgi:serine/threonine-protein kinase HipA
MMAAVPPPITDTLHLWWLGDPARPVPVGELALVRPLRGVSLRYGAHWLRHGFPLSEDLPLIDGERLPADKDTAVGAVDDARPDRWGERVIRHIDRPARLSLLEFLYHAGDERFGALGVSLSATDYRPRTHGPLPTLREVPQLAALVARVLAGEPVGEAERRLIAPGVSMGGARPKALLALDGAAWVLKFNEPGEAVDAPLVEHATMTLAARAGISVAETRAIPLDGAAADEGAGSAVGRADRATRHAVAVRRFDRAGGLRLHALSAHVALRAAGEALGYPELAQLLRRRGVTADGLARAQMQELFRRMVFNILVDNTDDHEKNHVLLQTDAGDYALSPAFDVLPAGQALGYQQLRVGRDGHEATLDNALSECALFSLTRAQAEAQLRQVVAVVDGWQAHFRAAGVTEADIDSLARQIDRPALAEPRRDWRQGR